MEKTYHVGETIDLDIQARNFKSGLLTIVFPEPASEVLTVAFTKEHIFDFPSTAASCILGSISSNKTLWKNESGVTLKNMYFNNDKEDI